MMPIESDRIRRSIMVYAGIMLLVTALAAALGSALPLYNELRASNEEKLLSLASARAGTARGFVRDAREAALRFASRTGLRLKLAEYERGEIPRAEASRFIRLSLIDAMSSEPDVAGVLCLDAKGAPIAHAGIAPPQALGQWVPGTENSILDPVPVRIGDRTFLHLRVPIYGSEGQVVGGHVLLHALEPLATLLNEGVDFDEHEETLIGWFPGGQSRVFFRLGRAEGAFADVEETMRRGLELAGRKQSGLQRMNVEGRRFLIVYAPIPGTEWGLCINESETALFRKLHLLTERLFFIIAGILILAMLGLLLLLRPLAGKLLFRTQDLEHQLQERTAALQEEKEQLLRLTRQLKSVNEELDAFTRTAAHDLRTPLVNIKGYADLLLMEEYGARDAEIRDWLGRVVNGALRANRLITDLLDFARAGRAEPARRRVDLAALSREILQGLRQQSPGRAAEFEIPDALPVQADPALLQVVMQNLLSNAWKYASKAAMTRIEVGETALEEYGRVFFVRDNGVGFDMLYATALFEPFRRLHSEKEFSGTGIGLSTVKRIVERHGGRIWAESAVNRGTAFFFTLGDLSGPPPASAATAE